MTKLFSTRAEKALYLRNFIFGIEDSLASMVGLLSGVAVAGLAREDIILTGIVLIFVEAFSMGAGSFLSEYSAEEYINQNKKDQKKKSIFGAIIMFGSYIVAGIVPLWPYLFMEINSALCFSILSSLIVLFSLGIFSAKISKLKPARRGLRMLVIGGLAILVGVFMGLILGR